MINPDLTRALAEARRDELHRAARLDRRNRARGPWERHRADDRPITLRFGFPDDADPLAQLAQLDSAEALEAPILLAEVSGELCAALSLADGRVVSDPFRPTAGVIKLLREREHQLTGRRIRRGRLRAWTRLALQAGLARGR